MRSGLRILPGLGGGLSVFALLTGLGLWQVRRAEEKSALILAADQAKILPPIFLTTLPGDARPLWYRSARLDCLAGGPTMARSGQDAQGRPGWIHSAPCRLAHGAIDVDVGWSRAFATQVWPGGNVTGVLAPPIGPSGGNGARLVADHAMPGLSALSRPDPRALPNNHWGYAFQWFSFAGIWMVILFLLMRRMMWRNRSASLKES